MSIQVNNLTHIYSQGLPHQSIALQDVTFTVEKGQFVGIIGHTGSGKSTLVQHLNGLLKPTDGTIVISGMDITAEGAALREIRKKIGLVFQYPEYQLFEETVAADVAFGPGNLGLPQEEIDHRVRQAMDLVGLDYETLGKRSPFDLSGGQKRKAAIAGVLAMKPEVLILDEPTAGLDPRSHKDILDMVQDIHTREQNTILLISHNMDDIARMSDKVLVMHQGTLVKEGTPRAVFREEAQLTSMGLRLPEPTRMAAKLRDKGIPLPEGLLTREALEHALAQHFGTADTYDGDTDFSAVPLSKDETT